MEATPNLRTLTVDEISRLTNIPERKVRRLIKSGYFPRIPMPGREVRVRESDVVEKIVGTLKCNTHSGNTRIDISAQAKRMGLEPHDPIVGLIGG